MNFTSLRKAVVGAAIGALALTATAGSASAELNTKEFKVVGTWSFLDHWKEREGPFWNEKLSKLSGGKLTANAKSQTELGLSGFEIMRLMKLGVFDAAHVVTGYIASDSPTI